MTGTNCDLFTNNQSRSYLNHLVFLASSMNITDSHTGELKVTRNKNNCNESQ